MKISASKKIDYKEALDSKLLNMLDLNIVKINGHNHKQIYETFVRANKQLKTTIVIADTVKGKGYGIAENNLKFNNNSPDKHTLSQLKKNYEH